MTLPISRRQDVPRTERVKFVNQRARRVQVQARAKPETATSKSQSTPRPEMEVELRVVSPGVDHQVQAKVVDKITVTEDIV